MTCPVCGRQMKIGYVRGIYILWKCLSCGYGEIAVSDKVNGERSKSITKAAGGREEKPPQSSYL